MASSSPEVAAYIAAQAAMNAALAPRRDIVRIMLIYQVACFAVQLVRRCEMRLTRQWDWIVLWPQEYRHIWRTNASPAKFAYIATRYISLANSIFELVVSSISWESRYDTCQTIAHLVPAGASLGMLSAEILLAIRISAIWQHDLKIVFALAASLLVEALCYILGSVYVQAAPLIPGALGCAPMPTPGQTGFALAYWITPAVVDLLFLALALAQGFKTRRECGSRPPVLALIALDQAAYFVVIFVLAALNAGFFAQNASTALKPLNTPLATIMPHVRRPTAADALSCVLACRMVLSLRSRRPEDLSIAQRSSAWSFKTQPTQTLPSLASQSIELKPVAYKSADNISIESHPFSRV